MGTMTPAQRRALYESARFARETTYNGPLGPEYTPAGTRLQLWAPTAEQAAVNLYRKGHDSPCIGTLPLQRGPQGVWSIWLPGDQHGHYYTFTVTVDGVARETGDPYARAGGLNGLRSMIVDLARTAPAGWERDVRPVIPPARRSVWEVSVRDFSQDAASGVRPAWRGKYLAFAERSLQSLSKLPGRGVSLSGLGSTLYADFSESAFVNRQQAARNASEVFRRFSARDLLLLSAACGLIRWGLMGWTTALPGLILAQILHCGTFTVCHLAAMRYIAARQGSEVIRLQAVYSAVAMGGSIAIMTVFAGFLYQHLHQGVFWVMALLTLPAMAIRPKAVAA